MNTLSTPSNPAAAPIRAELEATLQQQRAAYFVHPVPTLDERRADLRKLQAFIREHREGLVAAVNADYGHRSRHETLFTEIFPAIEVDEE